MDGDSFSAPRTVGPRVQFSGACEEPLMTGQHIQQEAICYQWFKQRLILSVSEPSISQRSQIKEDTVEPSVPAREFNLKAYVAITRHNDSASLGLEPSTYHDGTNSATEAGKCISYFFSNCSLVCQRDVDMCEFCTAELSITL